MFCPNCGTKLPDGSRFCGSCGANLATPTRQQQQQQQQPGMQQPGMQQPYAPGAYAKPDKLRKRGGKKKVVIGVVAAVVVVAVALVAVFGFTGRWVAVKTTNYSYPDSGDSIITTMTYTLDGGGAAQVITINTKRSNDDYTSPITYSYIRDQQGYATRQESTSSDGSSYTMTYTNTYLPDGRLSMQTTFRDGEKVSDTYYSYGSKGKVSSIRTEGNSSGDYYTTLNQYDEDGFLIGSSRDYSSSYQTSSTQTNTWTKDMLGRPTSCLYVVKYDDSSRDDYTETLKYETDLFGNITKAYDSKGRIVRETEYQFVPFACTAVRCQPRT